MCPCLLYTSAQNNLAEAERILRSTPANNAEWYYLMGSIAYRKGWMDDARQNFWTACNMDPSNMEYRQAMNAMGMQAQRGAYGGGDDIANLCTTPVSYTHLWPLPADQCRQGGPGGAAHRGGHVAGLSAVSYTHLDVYKRQEDVYEPYLMQIGFLTRTPRGRCVTRLAYAHLGLPFPGQDPDQLHL